MSAKNVLITGGAGFIGSNFVPYFMAKNPNVKVVNLDKMTYAADAANLADVANNPNYTFVAGDICNRALVDTLFSDYHIDGVIHFAAESHVDNSITGPEIFVKTNVLGTFQLLDAARLAWSGKPYRFHHISTDEVYGTLGNTGYFYENTPYAPNSPYSASKAASDMLVRSYLHTYGLNVTISNCSNNFGPKQHDEKLIPTVIRKCLAGKPIPVYGQGANVRDWLYVDDHCQAIDLIFHNATAGETYNIGGNCEKNNLALVNTICDILDQLNPRKEGSYANLISFVTDRPGHDLRYAICANKIKHDLGFAPKGEFTDKLTATIKWYMAKYKG